MRFTLPFHPLFHPSTSNHHQSSLASNSKIDIKSVHLSPVETLSAFQLSHHHLSLNYCSGRLTLSLPGSCPSHFLQASFLFPSPFLPISVYPSLLVSHSSFPHISIRPFLILLPFFLLKPSLFRSHAFLSPSESSFKTDQSYVSALAKTLPWLPTALRIKVNSSPWPCDGAVP